MSVRGITGVAYHFPAGRLSRRSMAEANSWLDPAGVATARGERAVANWDEDALTMSVEACRRLRAMQPDVAYSSLWFASTTAPFANRHNASIIVSASGLQDTIATLDVGGTLRAGTSALIAAFREAREGAEGDAVVLAADRRVGRPGSVIERDAGDGACAVAVGSRNVLARLIGCRSTAVDFVDQFRESGRDTDYLWEERWVRDAGHLTLIPEVVEGLLRECGTTPDLVAHVAIPVADARRALQIAKACRLKAEAIIDPRGDNLGDTGAAHALVLLGDAIARARAGDKILLLGFGQGVDAILLEATGSPSGDDQTSASALRRNRREWTSYMAFLAHRGQIQPEWGMRGETDNRTAMTALWRNSEAVHGLVGGRCKGCGAVQFPRSRTCANEQCRAVDSQEPLRLAEQDGRVVSLTADHLTCTPLPPAIYGTVRLDCGARLLVEFTDCGPEEIEVGTAVRLAFRIKDFDEHRGFRRYFWKAIPATASPGGG